MIRPERLTVKAAEALQQASALARERGKIGRASCRERV